MDLRPIPAFYCCYLLRSALPPTKPPTEPPAKRVTKPQRSLYIGSTPNPQRRLAQHNGHSKGGAVRTSRTALRPWQMTCIVSGFPSNIAALQFEWAWQNPHLTRRLENGQRITRKVKKSSPGADRTRRRPARPKMSLKDRLSNLHLLVRVPSFTRWPLEVRFFNEEVYRSWQECTRSLEDGIGSNVKTVLDIRERIDQTADSAISIDSQVKGKWHEGTLSKGGMEAIDASYAPLKAHLEKSLLLLAEGEINQCAVCGQVIQYPEKTTLVCPTESCKTPSHLTCLSKKFLQEGGEDGQLVPSSGNCPGCRSSLQWIDLVREMSLRIRGEKEIAQLMKKSRRNNIDKSKASISSKKCPPKIKTAVDDDTGISSGSDIDESDLVYSTSILDEPRLSEAYVDASHDDDTVSVTSVDSLMSNFSRQRSPAGSKKEPPRLEIVIEDTDWDSAEALD